METKKKETAALKHKLTRLTQTLQQMQSVLIAFSGGIDSSLLVKIAKQALGNNVLAVTAASPIYPQEELNFSRRLAAKWAVKHRIIKTKQLDNPTFINNPINRCYYCKRELFGRLWDIARKFNINFVLDASNASDLEDFRPGSQAKEELNVRSPLQECAIDKQDIYKLSQLLGLSIKNKPATVCLASRIPYGQQISPDDLKMIEQAEGYIKRLGVRQVRVRHHILGSGNFKRKLARIEVDAKDISRLAPTPESPTIYGGDEWLSGSEFRPRKERWIYTEKKLRDLSRGVFSGSCRDLIVRYLKRLGYDYITLDLEGYRLSGGR